MAEVVTSAEATMVDYFVTSMIDLTEDSVLIVFAPSIIPSICCIGLFVFVSICLTVNTKMHRSIGTSGIVVLICIIVFGY